MKVYFYHTQDIQMILQRMGKGEFPPHFLYGATKLKDYDIDVVWHKSRLGLPRWRMMLRNAWQILSCKEHFDAIYATHYRGIELVVLLRALGLFRKPIVIWHHQPIITPKASWREWLGRLFYRGFDHMFFFSQKLIDDSLKSSKARPERMHLGHWGMDTTPNQAPAPIPGFASPSPVMGKGVDTPSDSAPSENQGTSTPLPRAGRSALPLRSLGQKKGKSPQGEGKGVSGGLFISSGKEMRDMPTLIKAFNKTGARLDVYISKQNGEMNYNDIFKGIEIKDNIHVNWVTQLMPYELQQKVKEADCVVICCEETKYTVGLTTVVEALALGKPIICSRNPQIPVDFDKEGCGISVPYYDVEGWINAINYIASHPEEAREMGQRGLELARTTYNDRNCAREAAEVIKEACKVKIIEKR